MVSYFNNKLKNKPRYDNTVRFKISCILASKPLVWPCLFIRYNGAVTWAHLGEGMAGWPRAPKTSEVALCPMHYSCKLCKR